ncbi:ATP-binding protein [Streptomyces sp. HUAS 31]|uniref:ATP-binding protein n=1 Tax=Streptomyces sp. HUAS 31 TaxID=3020055 RepID=UPI002305DAC2|nr:ATP-binding protein [Streptomyces sp. HUAS 31]WCD99206.1 ATP-binding protein [Streptomyces sp. HUAS 31]
MTAPQAQPPVTVRVFTQAFPATSLGASLARRFALVRLDDWGIPPGAPLRDTVALLLAELAANAARHGRVPGRNFELRLLYERETAVVRIEVSDTHQRRPDPSAVGMADLDADGGRGLALIEAVAHRWGVDDRTGPGKTVWAETEPVGS